MKTIEAMRGKTSLLLSHYNLPPVTGKSHFKGECPLCKGVGKFRIDDKDGRGTWICVCGSGDLIKLLQEVTGKDFAALAPEVDLLLGNSYRANTHAQPAIRDKAGEARARFLSAVRIKGTQAEEYLHSRGIFTMPRGGVKYSDGEYDHDAGKELACLFAIASNEYGEPIYKHLTYLEDGEKAKVDTVRKIYTLKEYGGSVAVKLFEAGESLGVGEGIESALSAATIYKMPVWAALNATLMQKFRAPPGVKSLYIFADNDKNGTGLAAAFVCGRANILANNDVERVLIRWPLKLNDFNDMLTDGDDVVEWVLTK